MTSASLIEARHACLSYRTPRGPIAAVDGVSLTIAPGECVAIMGRSGSGKSTLLALLGGLCSPTSGEVLFADRSWRGMSPREKSGVRARDIGLLLQGDALLPGLRVIDNIVLPAVLAGGTHTAAVSRATELLRQVGLGERWDAYAAELSGGQQRRVALARALAAEPSVILADEPTSDLDGLAAREIIAILGRLRAERSMAIVVVTHDPELAALCDRRLWMERGRCTVVSGNAMPARVHPLAWPAAPENICDTVFEPAPLGLTPAEPAIGFPGLARSAIPFLIGGVTAAAGVVLVDGLVARKQEAVVQAVHAQRRLAEEMALQDLRADVDDVVVDAAARATVTLFLQNYRPERPLHVLGPDVEIGVQRDGRWDNVPLELEASAGGIRTVGGEKTLLPVRFTVPEGVYDELLRGYLHVRIGAAMVVSDRPDGMGDLFERQDAYYVYLRDPRRTEKEIRLANGWGDTATVPLWISMPSH
jgi:ABC-type lipoprotein export system ATPase subunit